MSREHRPNGAKIRLFSENFGEKLKLFLARLAILGILGKLFSNLGRKGRKVQRFARMSDDFGHFGREAPDRGELSQITSVLKI